MVIVLSLFSDKRHLGKLPWNTPTVMCSKFASMIVIFVPMEDIMIVLWDYAIAITLIKTGSNLENQNV